MLGKILGGLGALLLILIVLGFVLPDRVQMERSIKIDAPREEVFALVSDFNRWPEWSPWGALDPDTRYVITGDGVGHRMEWASDHPNVGSGSQVVTAMQAPRYVATHLDFGDMGAADAAFTLEDDSGGTRATWSFDTRMRQGVPVYMKPMSTWMGFFMEGMLAPDYEKGLANLKAAAEAS